MVRKEVPTKKTLILNVVHNLDMQSTLRKSTLSWILFESGVNQRQVDIIEQIKSIRELNGLSFVPADSKTTDVRTNIGRPGIQTLALQATPKNEEDRTYERFNELMEKYGLARYFSTIHGAQPLIGVFIDATEPVRLYEKEMRSVTHSVYLHILPKTG